MKRYLKILLFLIVTLSLFSFSYSAHAEGYIFSTKWGSFGAGATQFNRPYKLAIGTSSVYISDYGNNRIQVFSQAGGALFRWGTSGTGTTNIKNPVGVAIATSTGNVYITEYTNNRVHVFTAGGTYVTMWPNPSVIAGSGNGQFSHPYGIALDQAGNVYVADYGNNRIQKFNSAGTWMLSFDGTLGGGSVFNGPTGVSVDSAGFIYVTEETGSRLRKFDSLGNYVATLATVGSGLGQVANTQDAFVDSKNNIFVADYGNNRVEKFASTTGGAGYMTFFGSVGGGDGFFSGPSGITVATTTGKAFITDRNNNRIQVFNFVGDPTVSTVAADTVTNQSVNLNGNITNIQQNNLTSEGFEYGTTTAYGATTTSLGAFDVGVYTIPLVDLFCVTTYHYRAYVAHDYDIARGSDATFVTSACGPATVNTFPATVGISTVTLDGNVTDSGGSNITETGFQYGTDLNSYGATTTKSVDFYNLNGQTTSFDDVLSGIPPDTLYYLRAFTKNSAGYSYGGQSSFTTNGYSVSAAHVLGQADFTSAVQVVTRNSTYKPLSTAYDAVHKRLFVSDDANRILVYDLSSGISDHMNAAHVLGQMDFTSSVYGGQTSTTFSVVPAIVYDSDNNRLFVSDPSGYRVLVFDLSGGISDGMVASHVLGQADFNALDTVSVSQKTVGSPAGLTYDPNTKYLYVADTTYKRIMVFDLSGGVSDYMDATYVLGQADFTSSGSTDNLLAFGAVYNLAIDVARHQLFVSDTLWHRVTVFFIDNTMANFMPAQYVIGQFDTTLPTSAQQTQGGLSTPLGLYYDQTSKLLFITDQGAERVVIYDLTVGPGGAGVQNAKYVLGQGSFVTSDTGLASTTFAASSVYDVTYDSLNKRVFVVDRMNYRVMVFDFLQLLAHTFTHPTQGVAYSEGLSLVNKHGVQTWSISSGALPGGLSLNSSTGIVSGTPTVNGTFNFDVSVDDRISAANTFSDSKSYSLIVDPASSPVSIPTVTTSAASSITTTGVTFNGAATNNGGADATQHGFAYSTVANLSTVIATTTLGSFTGTGSFTDTASTLTCNTTYYFRAYATNSAGTGYGTIVSFTTSACVVTPPVTPPTSQSSQTSSGSGGGGGSILSLTAQPVVIPPSVTPPPPTTPKTNPPKSKPKSPPKTVSPVTVVSNNPTNNPSTPTTNYSKPVASIMSQLDVAFVDTKNGVMVAGAFGAFAAAGLLFATINLTLADLLYIPARLLGLILVTLGIRRKRLPWGVVYDSVTLQPIDPAIVTLLDASGKEVTQILTDINGRYGFLLAAGVYSMVSEKTNYQFPSRRPTGNAKDHFYDHLYFGKTFEVPQDGYVAEFNIPMDQMKYDWNEDAKKKQNLASLYSRHGKKIIWIINTAFAAGFVFSAISLMRDFDLVNLLVVILYTLMTIFLIVYGHFTSYGQVTFAGSGKPLPFAIVRVFGKDRQTIISKKVTDALGRYYCLVPKGDFFLTIDERNADGSYTEVYQSKVIRSRKGIIKKDIEV